MCFALLPQLSAPPLDLSQLTTQLAPQPRRCMFGCVISLAAKGCATHVCIAYPRNVYLEIEKVSYVFVWLELVLEDVVVQSEGVWS